MQPEIWLIVFLAVFACALVLIALPLVANAVLFVVASYVHFASTVLLGLKDEDISAVTGMPNCATNLTTMIMTMTLIPVTWLAIMIFAKSRVERLL